MLNISDSCVGTLRWQDAPHVCTHVRPLSMGDCLSKSIPAERKRRLWDALTARTQQENAPGSILKNTLKYSETERGESVPLPKYEAEWSVRLRRANLQIYDA